MSNSVGTKFSGRTKSISIPPFDTYGFNTTPPRAQAHSTEFLKNGFAPVSCLFKKRARSEPESEHFISSVTSLAVSLATADARFSAEPDLYIVFHLSIAAFITCDDALLIPRPDKFSLIQNIFITLAISFLMFKISPHSL